jgi:hypothetical protein
MLRGPHSLFIKQHTRLVVPEQMVFFAIRLLRSTARIRAFPMLLRVRSYREIKVNIIFFVRRGRTLPGFWNLLTVWKPQCLLKLAEKIENKSLSEVSWDETITGTVAHKPCSIQGVSSYNL